MGIVRLRHSINNREKILENDLYGHRSIILDSLEAAIRSVQPRNLISDKISIRGSRLSIKDVGLHLDLANFDKIIVVGAGKASGALAETLDSLIPSNIDLQGQVTVLEGTSKDFPTRRIQLNEASHPIPNSKGVKGTEKIVSSLRKATPGTLVLCLISGGGSALMVLPAQGISLRDYITTTQLLLKTGARIEEINCIRKHLSRIKGGQLLRFSNGGLVVSLILSDIIGNPLASIASGPTAPDPSTFQEAWEILSKYKLAKSLPVSVSEHIVKGTEGSIPETPKPGDPIFHRVTNYILGDNSIACMAALKSIKKRKRFHPYYLGSSWQGEARNLGENIAALTLTVQKLKSGFSKPAVLVWGGESTVTIRGTGKGGRNQEEALAALNFLRNQGKITIAFMGTDGLDGFSDSAGAIIDAGTFQR